jgi:uncharacterized metal-binding protein YceD (DUF177 family)
MSLIINLLDVPPSGLEIHHEVEPAALSLSPDEGTVIGSFSCRGNLLLTGECSAYFQGMLLGRVSRECVRCLALFEESLSLPCEAVFQKPSNAIVSNNVKGKGAKGQDVSVDESASDEDVYPIRGNDIDLLPAIREHVILATPIRSLCKEDCLGLCQVCGTNLNEGMCGCYTPITASSPSVPVQQSLSRKNQSKRSSVTVRRGS